MEPRLATRCSSPVRRMRSRSVARSANSHEVFLRDESPVVGEQPEREAPSAVSSPRLRGGPVNARRQARWPHQPIEHAEAHEEVLPHWPRQGVERSADTLWPGRRAAASSQLGGLLVSRVTSEGTAVSVAHVPSLARTRMSACPASGARWTLAVGSPSKSHVQLPLAGQHHLEDLHRIEVKSAVAQRRAGTDGRGGAVGTGQPHD